MLKREFAFELLELDADNVEQRGRIAALESMLTERSVVIDELRGLIASGIDVAPSPIRPLSPELEGPGAPPAPPLLTVPRPDPDRGAGTALPVHHYVGTGAATPNGGAEGGRFNPSP